MRLRPLPLVVALGALIWPGDLPAGPTDPAPTPSASAPLPLSNAPFSDEKSSPPKVTEWSSASEVAPTRAGPAAAGCRAHLVREWMRLRCSGKIFAISLVAGTPEGIAFWIGGSEAEPYGDILMPIRKGDRRVFQLWAPGQDGAGAFAPKPVLTVQEQWQPTDKSPVIVLW